MRQINIRRKGTRTANKLIAGVFVALTDYFCVNYVFFFFLTHSKFNGEFHIWIVKMKEIIKKAT